MLNIKQLLILLIDSYHVKRKRESFSEKGISYRNWWEIELKRHWFTNYLSNNRIVNNNIRFYSVFGPVRVLRENYEGIKIFYTCENIILRAKHERLTERAEKVIPFDNRAKQYSTSLNKCNMNLVLTFCTDGLNNAIRFPYWILSHFEGCYTLEDVRSRLKVIEDNYKNVDLSRTSAAVIASHDFFGTRADICNALSGYVDIDYAGKWRNNTDRLNKEYRNNKIEFLAGYRFNICPENMDAKEYVTEKIWDSFEAGCIPVYGGALGNPEPNIFNRESFILWSFDGDNTYAIAKISKIISDDNYYTTMKKKRIFVDGADEYIYSLIKKFDNRIRELRTL